MVERTGTWGELTVGVLTQAPDLKHWMVVGEATDGLGQRWIRIMSRWKEYRSVERRPDHEPIVIVEATEEEAIQLARMELGAHHIVMIADDQTLGRRATRWRMDPINHKGRGGKDRLRDHIDMHHGVYVNDGWSKKTVAELVQAHGEMHADETLTMSTPHHHEEGS